MSTRFVMAHCTVIRLELRTVAIFRRCDETTRAFYFPSPETAAIRFVSSIGICALFIMQFIQHAHSALVNIAVASRLARNTFRSSVMYTKRAFPAAKYQTSAGSFRLHENLPLHLFLVDLYFSAGRSMFKR